MTLMSIGLPEPGTYLVADFVEFLDHVYSRTNTLVSSEEPMRRIISQLATADRGDERADEPGGGDLVQD